MVTRSARDITDQKLKEERLGDGIGSALQTDEALQAERRITDDFVSMVAHDLKNPVHAILMASSMLMQNVSSENESAKKRASSISKTARIMSRLISDILDVEAINTGILQIHPSSCDMIEVLHDTIEIFEPIAAADGVRLECELGHDKLMAMIDRDRIFQVLSNLLGNALNYSDEGSHVEIKGSIVGKFIQIDITNQGPKIPIDEQTKIFDRFYRFDKSAKRGTVGMGLYISRWIVEAHCGRIWLSQSHGITFSFTIPISDNADFR